MNPFIYILCGLLAAVLMIWIHQSIRWVNWKDEQRFYFARGVPFAPIKTGTVLLYFVAGLAFGPIALVIALFGLALSTFVNGVIIAMNPTQFFKNSNLWWTRPFMSWFKK